MLFAWLLLFEFHPHGFAGWQCKCNAIPDNHGNDRQLMTNVTIYDLYALPNNLAKIYNARNHIYGENVELKFCTCVQIWLWKDVQRFSSKKVRYLQCFRPRTFSFNIGLDMLPLDSFMSCLHSLLGYSTGEFQALQLIVLVAFGAVD